MSEGIKQRANSFTQYVRPNLSTELSTDQLRSVVRCPIQILQSMEFNNVNFTAIHKSFEGLDPQNQFRPHYSNDFWFKSREGVTSRSNFAYIGQSPAVSLPWVQLQASDQKFSCTSLDNQRNEPAQDHFKKEEFKLLATEESQSHDVRAMESSWSESIPKQRKKKGRKRKDDDSSESYRIVRKKKTTKINDTKNITKNFSKAIISFILNNPEITCQHMSSQEYVQFTQMLSSRKNQMTNIKQLRDLWVEEGEKPNFNRVFRIMRYQFR